MIERDYALGEQTRKIYTPIPAVYDSVLENTSMSWCGANINIINLAYHATTITVHVTVRVDKYDSRNKGNEYAIRQSGLLRVPSECPLSDEIILNWMTQLELDIDLSLRNQYKLSSCNL